MSNSELRRFLGIAFVLAFAGQIATSRLGGEASTRALLMLVMWTPAIAAFLSGTEARGRLMASLKTAGTRWLLPALLIGWMFTLLQSLLLAASAAGKWNATLFPIGAAGISSTSRMLLGNAPQSLGAFALNWILTLLAGSLVSVLPALGEELGWRSTLQPEMDRRFSPLMATVVVGLLWGYWHLPINALGLNDPVHPIVNALFVFPCLSVLLAFPFSWLWRKSSSVWPPALCHGAGDAILGGALVVPNSWIADTTTLAVVTLAIAAPFMVMSLRSCGLERRRNI